MYIESCTTTIVTFKSSLYCTVLSNNNINISFLSIFYKTNMEVGKEQSTLFIFTILLIEVSR